MKFEKLWWQGVEKLKGRAKTNHKIHEMATYFFILITILFTGSEKKTPGHVTTSERYILLNNKQFLIKGICYHPVPKGSEKRNFDSLQKDLALMNEAGINTIRVYEPISEKPVLDQIHEAGIKLIVGFGYNQRGNFDILS